MYAGHMLRSVSKIQILTSDNDHRQGRDSPSRGTPEPKDEDSQATSAAI